MKVRIYLDNKTFICKYIDIILINNKTYYKKNYFNSKEIQNYYSFIVKNVINIQYLEYYNKTISGIEKEIYYINERKIINKKEWNIKMRNYKINDLLKIIN